MNLGPHLSKSELEGWKNAESPVPFTAVQIFPGNPQSYSVDWGFKSEVAAVVRAKAKVVVHACYMAYCNNSEANEARALKYILDGILWTTEMGFDTFLVHMGATKGKEPEEVAAGIARFAAKIAAIEHRQGKCAVVIENVAANYPANNSDLVLEAITKTNPAVGLCIDTAHAFGAGWTAKETVERIEKYRPRVIHLNAPASYIQRGCGKDRHGWWYEEKHPGYLEKVLMAIVKYDPILILEGASEPGDANLEYEYVKAKIQEAKERPAHVLEKRVAAVPEAGEGKIAGSGGEGHEGNTDSDTDNNKGGTNPTSPDKR